MNPSDHNPLRIHPAYGDKEAIVDGDKRVSFTELAEIVDTVAANFIKLGIGSNDRVAIHLHNCLEIIISYYACFRIGAIAMPVNNRFAPVETEILLKKGRPKLLITEEDLLRPLLDHLGNLSVDHCYTTDCQNFPGARSFDELLKDNTGDIVFPELDDDHLMTLFFTSGTTGDPKGALHARRQHIANVHNQNAQYGYIQGDSALIYISLCHTFALLRGTMPTLYAGSRIVLLKEFEAKAAARLISEEKITLLFGLPATYALLVDEVENQHALQQNQLRLCIASGDAVPVALHERFQTHFGIALTEAYSSTEAMMITSNPAGNGKRTGSIGKAINGVDFIVSDTTGKPVPNDETGEVLVKSETIMSSYFENPEATKRAFRDGWFCTGDLASVDEDGFLWFHGRSKQIIVRGGSNIVPHDVESALFQHPDVLEAGVVGVPDSAYGQRVRAYVVIKSESKIKAKALRDFARDYLAEYKLPEEIIFLTNLPKGASGKVDRKALESMNIQDSIYKR
ncbi:class I adenylate-forming enzyme family protein [Rubellicoccus peritrichatus]|uniref:AMP-binding protein n=1 Tax=Rubellicoccus peritrichatus TaxID=3080537 RepID=A0AAQ3LAS0_9BACT|nr:AMP-binding protein [Puniceicoccus sp. CR14]WOO42689.1 AMP-binding protein [Puniceicoccus sp. CR14]